MLIWLYKYKNIDINSNAERMELQRLREEKQAYLSKQKRKMYTNDGHTPQNNFKPEVINIDKLSTGCKTTLNILYNPDVIFDIRECGENALDVIYSLPKGKVYCDYPLILYIHL